MCLPALATLNWQRDGGVCVTATTLSWRSWREVDDATWCYNEKGKIDVDLGRQIGVRAMQEDLGFSDSWNKGENPLSLANQAHEIPMHWAGVGGEVAWFSHPTNNGGDAIVLLPTFRRAIIAFRAQLPLLYGQCAHLGGATHTRQSLQHPLLLSLPPFLSSPLPLFIQATLRIPHVARPWLFSLYICTVSFSLSLSLCLSPSSPALQHAAIAIGCCRARLCADSCRRDVTTTSTSITGVGGCCSSAASSRAKPSRRNAVVNSDVRQRSSGLEFGV